MSRAGKLLIAHPNLPSTDPFYKSVVLLHKDDHEGAQGLILNKPSEFYVSDFFSRRGLTIPTQRETMRFGGPLNTKQVVMLHSDGWYSSTTQTVTPGISISGDEFMMQKIAMGDLPRFYRMFIGVSGWAPKQLDAEFAGKAPFKPENSWLIAHADNDLVFEHDSQRQWSKALERSSHEMINQFF